MRLLGQLLIGGAVLAVTGTVCVAAVATAGLVLALATASVAGRG